MAYSAQSFYRPGVMPDTQGLAPGIAGAGSAIAGALGTYAGWKQNDKVRADEQQFATQRDNARMAQESAMIDKRMDRDMTMFGMQQDAQKQEREVERAMADEQLRAANAGKAAFLGQSGYDPIAVAAASKMSPKAAAEFLDSAMAQAGLELRARMEAQQAEQKAKAARESFPLFDPATGKPDAAYFMTGNGQVVPRQGAKAGPSAEELQKMGLVPSSAKVGGVTFERTGKTPKPSEIRTVVTDPALGTRSTVIWDEQQGQWVPWSPPMAVPSAAAAGAVADPSNAIRSILQSRQK